MQMMVIGVVAASGSYGRERLREVEMRGITDKGWVCTACVDGG